MSVTDEEDSSMGAPRKAAVVTALTLGLTALTAPVTRAGEPEAAANQPPVAVVSDAYTYCASWAPLVGPHCYFYARGSYDPDGEIVSWVWDFGGEELITDVGDTFFGYAAGHNGGTLTVVDNEGATDTVAILP
ncbi:hypothetical protein [Streptomyces hoynatensis]|uniref:PKD domain-containing protein n=1 Tax=Streptomyces hoynatensis TaxID=1141874 RepID=A0A3A9YRR7_9ACTN|nr:hypothetical protein [Streptomyces hoynatensis]RKN38509.1 hypothetical protein D7294_23825 [Streptomyces hoynatensis]